MSSWYNEEPKVTQCVIAIQEHLKSRQIESFDSFLVQTAVKKYYIGLGQDDLTNYTFDTPFKDHKYLFSLMYPIIRIAEEGFSIVKCPSINGKQCSLLETFTLKSFRREMDA